MVACEGCSDHGGFNDVVGNTLTQPFSIKLDRNNYTLWRNLVSTIIMGHRLEGYVNGTKPCPTEFVGAPGNGENTPARSLWVALENLYGAHSRAKMDDTRTKIQTTRKGGTTMADYLLRSKRESKPWWQLKWKLCREFGGEVETPSPHVKCVRIGTLRSIVTMIMMRLSWALHQTTTTIMVKRSKIPAYIATPRDCWIIEGSDIATRKVVLQGRLKDGLYQLEGSTIRSNSHDPSAANTPNLAHESFLSSVSYFSNLVESSSKSVFSVNQSHVNQKDIWHRRLGHPSSKVLSQVLSMANVKVHINENQLFCEACQYGKSHALPFKTSNNRATKVLELIHTDLWGPSPVMSNTNLRYYIHFVDDFSRYTWIYPLKAKSDALGAFIQFKNLVENQFDTKIKKFQTDWGEYQSFSNLVIENGILFQHSCLHTSEQNGRAERKHRYIVELGLTLLAQAHMPLKFWCDAFQTSVFLINRLPTPVLRGKSPIETLFDQVDLSNNLYVDLDFARATATDHVTAGSENIAINEQQDQFVNSRADTSLFLLKTSKFVIMVLIYVDDIVITGNVSQEVNNFIAKLHKVFALKDLGPLNYFLGIEIFRDATGMYLSQEKYVSELLKRLEMTSIKPCATPMTGGKPLSIQDGTELKDFTQYRSVIGALQYLTHTRPDIAFAVNKLSQFLKCPTSTHWAAVKRISRYLKGTIHYGIHIKYNDKLSVVGYCDADWACCPNDRKSIAGYCVYLGDSLTSWCSKKQSVVARSSTEFEYRALA
uniref:Integrase catalytic domain-containing protein n=1 Tax=Cannabis sativa TaxID=3483 RepID=A0A803P2C0_CANSA